MADVGDILARMWENVLARPSGALALRFLLQPTVASLLAIRDGIQDAHAGRSPYFWTVATDPKERWVRLREGVSATSKVLFLALVLDAIYQVIELKTLYPGEAVIIAFLLAFVPYLVVRGPAARLARRWRGRTLSG